MMSIKRTAIQFMCYDDNDDSLYELENDFAISSIGQPLQHSVPNIIISKLSSIIGICDDLILDARSTTNLGGRDNAVFDWQISIEETLIVDNYGGSYVEISADSLLKDATYHIVLTVTNWYSAISTTDFNVYISNKAIPNVYLHGIREYSSTNLNLNGVVDIFAEITFDDHCLNEENIELEYKISWTVETNTIMENDPITIDNEHIVLLREFLDEENEESISIDVSSLLQSGLVYIFNVNVQCIGDYECDVYAIHTLTFPYSDIQCKIDTNYILLNNVDPMHDLNFAIALDGETFSYNPDDDDTLLQWNWNCVDDEHILCESLLQSTDSGIIDIDLSVMTFKYDTNYLFTIDMTVSDTRNVYRDNCVDTFILEINTLSNEHHIEVIKSLIVTVTSIASQLSKSDRLRLLGNVVNYAVIINKGMIVYEWTELNGLLSGYDIENFKETSSDNALNLILKEDVLESGKMYSFQLMVKQYDDMDNLIAEGVSVPIGIYVLKEPKIVSGSFKVEAQCNDEFESIKELLSTSYSLSLSADGDYTPLFYLFGYQYQDQENVYYFDSINNYESFLSNIYVPIGDFSIFVDVIDSKSSVISDTISCSISLKSYTVCLDLEKDIDYLQTMNYLQYLFEYEAHDSCVQESLESIIGIIYESMLQSSSDVILLSQTMTLWMDLVATDLSLIDMFYNDGDLFDTLQLILMAILDPSSYITDSVPMIEALYVSEHSIVTKIPKIYYAEIDVTHYLSPIIIHYNYHHLLYSLTSSMIELFRNIPSQQYQTVYNLLWDSLYISELIRVSLSIPYESAFTEFADFSIYSARIKNQDIHVSVTDIAVSIPKDVTNTGSGGLFDSTDVLIIGINSSADNVSIDSKCDDVTGTLSENSVSITLSGNNTDTWHLSSNISFIFSCDPLNGCDESVECSWYNKPDDIWQNEGCNTEINYNSKSVFCSCNHLTTFATIHNIHAYKCDKDNDYVDEWLKSNAWNVVNICMVIVFLLLFLFTIKEVYPFFMIKNANATTPKSVVAVVLIGITAFLYILVYIQAYITRRSMQKGEYMDLFIKIYTLLLLLPQVTLFMLFTLIFYTWFGLAHSFIKNLDDVQKRMRYLLSAVNILIWSFLIVYYVLILTETNNIFDIAAYIWSTLLSIAAIFITIYSFLVGKVLYKASQISQHQYFGDKDWEVVRRLLVINAFLTLYFVFQAFTTVYLTINPHYQTVIYSTLYSFTDALCLLFIFWMYRSSLHHLREQESMQLQRCKSKTVSDAYRSRQRVNSEPVTTTSVIAPRGNVAKAELPSSVPMVQILPSRSLTMEDSKRSYSSTQDVPRNDEDGAVSTCAKPDEMDPDDSVDKKNQDSKRANSSQSMTVSSDDADVPRNSLMKNDFSGLNGIGSSNDHLETIQ